MSGNLFVLPFSRGFAEVYGFLRIAVRKSELAVLVYDGDLSRDAYMELVEYVSFYGDDGGESFGAIPKEGYIEPAKYDIITTSLVEGVEHDIGVAENLSDSNIWALSLACFGGSAFMCVPRRLLIQGGDNIIRDWAFGGWRTQNLLLKCAMRGRCGVNYAVFSDIDSQKAPERCIVLFVRDDGEAEELRRLFGSKNVPVLENLDF